MRFLHNVFASIIVVVVWGVVFTASVWLSTELQSRLDFFTPGSSLLLRGFGFVVSAFVGVLVAALLLIKSSVKTTSLVFVAILALLGASVGFINDDIPIVPFTSLFLLPSAIGAALGSWMVSRHRIKRIKNRSS
ncbi:MAG: hypothetical protein OD811_01355 [Alphaproteobacteria bacterium]